MNPSNSYRESVKGRRKRSKNVPGDKEMLQLSELASNLFSLLSEALWLKHCVRDFVSKPEGVTKKWNL